jgi:hypothetical protein
MAMGMARDKINEAISGHEGRNAALRTLLIEKKVNLIEPRVIECHFWTWSEEDTIHLGSALESRGFTVLLRRQAAKRDDQDLWNLEVAVTQSVEVTTSPEFTEDLVRVADSHHGRYDGWGTSI